MRSWILAFIRKQEDWSQKDKAYTGENSEKGVLQTALTTKLALEVF